MRSKDSILKVQLSLEELKTFFPKEYEKIISILSMVKLRKFLARST